MERYGAPVYTRELGDVGRLELFDANGGQITVEYAVIGDVNIDREIVLVGDAEEVRKAETREVEITKTVDDQLYGTAVIDDDVDNPWSIVSTSDSGVMTTLNLRRRFVMRKRLRGRHK